MLPYKTEWPWICYWQPKVEFVMLLEIPGPHNESDKLTHFVDHLHGLLVEQKAADFSMSSGYDLFAWHKTLLVHFPKDNDSPLLCSSFCSAVLPYVLEGSL